MKIPKFLNSQNKTNFKIEIPIENNLTKPKNDLASSREIKYLKKQIWKFSHKY